MKGKLTQSEQYGSLNQTTEINQRQRTTAKTRACLKDLKLVRLRNSKTIYSLCAASIKDFLKSKYGSFKKQKYFHCWFQL